MLLHRLLDDGAARTPDKVALRWIDRDRSLTYAQAVEQRDRVAGALHGLGVTPGDRVTVFAHNGLDYLAAMFGTWRLGAIAALVNVQYAAELGDYLADHTPSVVIYTHDQGDAVRAAAAAVGSARHLVCLDGPQEGALSWPELLEGAGPPPPDPGDETAIAHLSYTSGSTGRPKGACLAHEPTLRAAACIGERLRVTPHEISFGPTALSSSYQLVANLLPPLHQAATVCVLGRWQADTGWQQLADEGATMLVANPTLLTDVLVESRRRGGPPKDVRFALSGGGPVPRSLKVAWRDELGLPLVESYGQSELGGFVALGRPRLRDDDRIGPIGRALPDKEVRVVDPDDREVPCGATGELVLRGGFMVGYWNRPEQTAEALRGGWLHTGDLGVLDTNGEISLRGRASERLVVRGEVWFPRDLEEVLAEHPAVRQAAVVGRPDAELGHRPTAFVTLQPGAAATPDELLAQAEAGMDRPLDVVVLVVVDALPMTPTGKIAKAELL